MCLSNDLASTTGMILMFLSKSLSNSLISFLFSSGIKTVLIPKENEKDLRDLPESVLHGLEIIAVGHVSEVLKVALTSTPEAILWDEAAEEAAAALSAESMGKASATAH